MTRRSITIVSDRAREHVKGLVDKLPDGAVVTLTSEPLRTLSQNALLWPMLAAFSRQRSWPVNGFDAHLSPDDWKDVLTASFVGQRQVRVAPTLDGRFVMLGARTHEFTVGEFAEFVDYVQFAARELGVDIDRRAS